MTRLCVPAPVRFVCGRRTSTRVASRVGAQTSGHLGFASLRQAIEKARVQQRTSKRNEKGVFIAGTDPTSLIHSETLSVETGPQRRKARNYRKTRLGMSRCVTGSSSAVIKGLFATNNLQGRICPRSRFTATRLPNKAGIKKLWHILVVHAHSRLSYMLHCIVEIGAWIYTSYRCFSRSDVL